MFLTTGKDQYKQYILSDENIIKTRISSLGWLVGRVLPKLQDVNFTESITSAVASYANIIKAQQKQNPFGVPYQPYIWGAGWNIQQFGVEQYFLHTGFPKIVDKEYMLNALNFVLGCHPGENTASFASGIGARSFTTGYCYYRAEWSYIPARRIIWHFIDSTRFP